jgi:hypothetical protein
MNGVLNQQQVREGFRGGLNCVLMDEDTEKCLTFVRNTFENLGTMTQQATKEVRMYLRIRNLCGLLGILLPWIALFASAIRLDKHPQWWWSISATYHQAPEAIVGVLIPACIVMMSYIGYDWKDNLITSLDGLFGMGIVLFPCKVDWIPDGTPVGFFQLPIEFSYTIHVVCSVLFFLLAAVNILWLFTRHGDRMTKQKKVRNVIYRICGWGMIGLMVLLTILMLCNAPGWWVMVIEILLLHLFGLAWIVKGGFFPFLNDKEE